MDNKELTNGKVSERYKFKETSKAVIVLFQILKYVVLVIACLLVIVPLLVVLLGSFKTQADIVSTRPFDLPQSFEWENYKTAFIDGGVLTGLRHGYNGYYDRICSTALHHAVYKACKEYFPCCRTAAKYCNAGNRIPDC